MQRFGHPHKQGDDKHAHAQFFIPGHGPELFKLGIAVACGQADLFLGLVAGHDEKTHAEENAHAIGQRPQKPLQPRNAAISLGQHAHQHIMAERAAHEHVAHEDKAHIACAKQAVCRVGLAFNAKFIADAHGNGRRKRGLGVHAGNERPDHRARTNQPPYLPGKAGREQLEHPERDTL